MDIHPKNNLFLFDWFGIEGFKLFIVDNDQKIINELLYNFKKCESKSSQKSKLCTMNVFYKNLFDSDEKSKILSHQTLNKSTLETIINEIFSTDVDENEHIIKNFKEEYEL